jgi:hypothetical protein
MKALLLDNYGRLVDDDRRRFGNLRPAPEVAEDTRKVGRRSVHLHSRPVSNILEGSSKPAILSLSANLGRIPVAVKFPTVLPPDETP